MPRKRQIQPAPTLLIQRIHVEWTKASRGGPAAPARNSVPWRLAVPLEGAGALEGATVIHTVIYGEANAFAEPLKTALAVEPGIGRRAVDALWLDPNPPDVRINVPWNVWAGAPTRRPIRNLMSLAPGSWAQIAYNARQGWDAWWTYHRYVINIGLLPGAAAETFVATEPIKTRRFLADLW